MKKFIKIILIAVIVLGARFSYASNQHPAISVRVLDATSFAFYLKQIDGQKLKIAIKDDAGNTLFSKYIRNKSSFARKMNLKDLPDGSYSLEISDNIGTLSYPIQLSAESLSASEDNMVSTFHPIIKEGKNSLSLAIFSPAKHKHQLNIYNERNELIHDETIEATVNYQKQFDFSGALPGSYSIVINSQGHEYVYSVPVE